MKKIEIIVSIANVISKTDVDITPKEFINILERISDVLFGEQD